MKLFREDEGATKTHALGRRYSWASLFLGVAILGRRYSWASLFLGVAILGISILLFIGTISTFLLIDGNLWDLI